MKFCIPACLITLALVSTCAFASTTKPMTPIPTGYSFPSPPADPDHFSFVVTGDNRSTGYGYPQPPCFAEICSEIGLLHPPFTMWTGDIIQGYGDSVADVNAEYDVVLQTTALTAGPVFNAVGNHEFSLDARLLPVYLKRMAPLYGSFDYGNSHFVLLNTNAVWPDGTIHDGSLDDAQWAWLDSDLAANKSAKNIFVFMHHYPFGPPDPDNPDVGDTGWVSIQQRDRLHAMMVKYGVRAVFAGHNHIYYHTVQDRIDYYISGGAGAPLDAPPDRGGFLHYLMVDVAADKIKVSILQPYHLDVRYPHPNEAWIANTEAQLVTLNHLVFRVPKLPAQSYAVAASVAYKTKNKPTDAAIVSTALAPGGKFVDIVVSVVCPKSRTTDVVLAPALAGR